MAVDLTPRQPTKAYGGDGGAYYEWSPAELPMLGVASIGAAKLSLAAGGMSLPSYSDSAKVAYVLQGKGTCGIVVPEATKEKVVAVKEGDALALPFGVVTWWHNTPESATELVEAKLDVDIPNGGRVVVLNTLNLPLVKEVGLGADLVRIDAHSMCSPGFSCDSAYQVTYIVRGSGRVQVVGPDGKRVLETRIEGGSLFIVPRFHVVSKIADASGMEWFSIITTPNPIFSHLAGKTSVWKAISSEVLEAAFNTTPEMEKLFRSKRLDSEIFFAPN